MFPMPQVPEQLVWVPWERELPEQPVPEQPQVRQVPEQKVLERRR